MFYGWFNHEAFESWDATSNDRWSANSYRIANQWLKNYDHYSQPRVFNDRFWMFGTKEALFHKRCGNRASCGSHQHAFCQTWGLSTWDPQVDPRAVPGGDGPPRINTTVARVSLMQTYHRRLVVSNLTNICYETRHHFHEDHSSPTVIDEALWSTHYCAARFDSDTDEPHDLLVMVNHVPQIKTWFSITDTDKNIKAFGCSQPAVKSCTGVDMSWSMVYEDLQVSRAGHNLPVTGGWMMVRWWFKIGLILISINID